MTIGIAIAVPDGIALCADSQTTWEQTITTAKFKVAGTEELVDAELAEPFRKPVGWSSGARKVFPFKYGEQRGDGAPLFAGILTAGMANISNRSVRSLFKKIEQDCPRTSECQQVVDYIIAQLKAELLAHFQVTDLNNAPLNSIEFTFSAYEDRNITKPFVAGYRVFSGQPQGDAEVVARHYVELFKNSGDGARRYNGGFIGRAEFPLHITGHSNTALPSVSGQFFLMTLEDAVAYTRFLAEFTCDYQRFATMVPDCGKPVVSAILTVDGGFKYLQQGEALPEDI